MKKDVNIHIHPPKQKDEVKPVTNALTPSNFYVKYKPRKQKVVLTPPNFYTKYKPRKQILTTHPFEYNMEILNKQYNEINVIVFVKITTEDIWNNYLCLKNDKNYEKVVKLQ